MRVTLTIGSRSLRVMATQGRQVRRWGSQPLEEGLVRDGLILQPQAVGEAIAALFRASRIPGERVIAAVTGLSFTSRFIRLPRLKGALLEEALPRAAAREIPLPPEELYLAWQPLETRDDETTYFVLGVPRQLVDALPPALAAAGLEPSGLDLVPLALARAAGRAEAIVASLEPDSFDIVFIAGGWPALMHTASPRGGGATLEDNIRRFSEELRKTATFYQGSHPEAPLGPDTPLLLAGEMAGGAIASGLLREETAYPTSLLAPPLESPPDLPVALYAANMGLALPKSRGDGAHYHDVNIDVLSRRQPPRRTGAGNLLMAALLVMAVGLIFPLYQAASRLEADNARQQEELRQVSRELTLARLAAAQAAATEDAIRAMNAATGARQQEQQRLLSTRGAFTRELAIVTGALPPPTVFTQLALSGGRATVRGETDSPFTAVSYAAALEASGAFGEARLTELGEKTTPEATAVTFAIVMQR